MKLTNKFFSGAVSRTNVRCGGKTLVTSALCALFSLALGTASVAIDFSGVTGIASRIDTANTEGAESLTNKLEIAELTEGSSNWDANYSGKDVAVVSAADNKIKIEATTLSAASYGLGQYIRKTAKGHISWCGNRYPTEWPLPTTTAVYQPKQPVRLAYNYCTLSYTMAFWSQKEWREEIDRLALSGMNVALVLQGLPKVWKLVLESVKDADGSNVYSDTAIKNFISDEAAEAWWHMGNLEGLGGPLSDERIEKDAELGEFIYAEMMKVGISPMLQSFVGLMPTSSLNGVLARGVPIKSGSGYATYGDDDDFTVTGCGSWCNCYVRPALVNPACYAFDDLATLWYNALKTVYNIQTDTNPQGNAVTKYLCGDLFHEGGSTSLNATELAAVGAKVQKTQKEHFGDKTTWVLQKWQITDTQLNVIKGLAASNTLIQVLDRNCGVNTPHTSDVVGNDGAVLPFIYAEVWNFGGNTGMNSADTRVMAVNRADSSVLDKFRGYGMLSEGFETNPVHYDMYIEQMDKDLEDVLTIATVEANFYEQYRLRRYGWTDDNLKEAFRIMRETAWHQFTTTTVQNQIPQGTVENILCAGPSYSLLKASVSAWGPKTGTEYTPSDLIPAAEKFLAAIEVNPSLKELDTFKFDFVELFLQLLGDRAREINAACASSQSARNQFRQLLALAERLTACSPRWRLDWHEGRTTTTDSVNGPKGYRRMVTSWTGNYDTAQAIKCQLRDYGHRAYSGLIKGYYAKRWEWYFQKTEGTLSGDYTTLLKNLDTSIVTDVIEELDPESDNLDIVEIGREILNTLNPPALTLVSAGESWETSEWKNANDETVSWEDGKDVTIGGRNLAINANNNVTVRDLTVTRMASNTYTATSGYVEDGVGTDLGWSGITLDDLLAFDYKGEMGGAWIGGGKTTIAAEGFWVERADDSVTMQFHALDGSYNKVVAIKFTIVNGTVHATYQWAHNGNTSTYGTTKFTSSSSDANSTPNGKDNGVLKYAMKTISVYPASNVTVGGPVSITGDITIEDVNALTLLNTPSISQVNFLGKGTFSAPAVTAIGAVNIEGALATIILGESQQLTINSVTMGSTGKLVIKGAASTISASSDARVQLLDATGEKFRPTGTVVYVCMTEGDPNYGVEQEMTVAASGYLKDALKKQSMTEGTWLTKTAVSTGWTGITLADLAQMQFTAKMDGGYVNEKYKGAEVRGYQINYDEDAQKITVLYQLRDDGTSSTSTETFLKVVGVEFTFVDGVIYAQATGTTNKMNGSLGESFSNVNSGTLATSATANGYGVYDLVITPAVAHVEGINSNYAVLDDAVTPAGGTHTITLLDDITVSSRITSAVKIVIPYGLKLTATILNFIKWNVDPFQLDIYGTLDLQDNLSISDTYHQVINLYAGGKIRSSGSMGLSVCDGVSMNVKADSEFDVAVFDTIITARHHTTNNVESGVTALCLGDIKIDDGESPTFTKTGAGTMRFDGALDEGITFILEDGTFKRVLAPEASFTLTKNGGDVDITSGDSDYEIIETSSGNVYTYTSQEIPWLCYVTDPGVTTATGSGTKYRTYAEALAAALALKEAHPYKEVMMWAVESRVESLMAQLPEGISIEVNPSGMKVTGWEPAQNYLYFPDSSSEWTDSTKGCKTAGGAADTEMTKDTLIIFDEWKSTSNFYIHPDVLPTNILITGNSTLLLGAQKTAGQDNKSNLRDGKAVTVDFGSTLKFMNWGNTNRGAGRLGDVTLNGEGTIIAGPTEFDEMSWGNISGTAKITIENGMTITANGTVQNVLTGAGTIKATQFDQSFTVDSEWTGTIGATMAAPSGYDIVYVETQNDDGTVTWTVTMQLDESGADTSIGGVEYAGSIYTWIGTTAFLHNGGWSSTTYSDSDDEYHYSTITTSVGKEFSSSAVLASLSGAVNDYNTYRFVPSGTTINGTAVSSDNKAVKIQFNNGNGASFENIGFKIGGLIVDSGATGFSFIQGGDRYFGIGEDDDDTVNMTIKEDFRITANGILLKGMQRWDVASGKTLNFDTDGVEVKLAANAVIDAPGSTTFNKLSGEGTLDLGSTGSFTFNGNDCGFDDWSGTIKLADRSQDGLNLTAYGNEGSVVELKGFSGYFSQQENGSFNGNIRLVNGTNGYAVKITNGYGDKTMMLGGTISGTGEFQFNRGDATCRRQKIKFTGNLGGFTGKFKTADGNGIGCGDLVFGNGTDGQTLGNFTIDWKPIDTVESGTDWEDRGSVVFDYGTDHQVTFGGTLTGPTRIKKTGDGTLVLGGTGNDYTGGTTIAAGKLRITNTSALGSGAVDGTGTLDIAVAGLSATPGSTILSGDFSGFTGTVLLNGSSITCKCTQTGIEIPENQTTWPGAWTPVGGVDAAVVSKFSSWLADKGGADASQLQKGDEERFLMNQELNATIVKPTASIKMEDGKVRLISSVGDNDVNGVIYVRYADNLSDIDKDGHEYRITFDDEETKVIKNIEASATSGFFKIVVGFQDPEQDLPTVPDENSGE